jgi:hypothetical protein
MIKLRNKRLAAVAAIAGLGIAAVATPTAALAASSPAHATVVKADPVSPDRAGTKEKRDTASDRAASVEKASVDRARVERALDG